MLLAEANQWPEDAVAYFGDGDECHMAFHFPLMPRLFMAMHMEDRFPIIDILEQTPAIPPELPVGDVPAQPRRADARDGDRRGARLHVPRLRRTTRRCASTSASAAGSRRCCGNDRRKIELMNGLLFSLPGTPVLYYGDEIGMGDNIYLGDRNGVRTPMQWSADRNAGFSRANPQQLYLPVIIDPEYHYEAINVEAQQNNPNSLLWWMKRLIALRKRYRGLRPRHARVPAPGEPQGARLRAHATRTRRVLVVANLSRFVAVRRARPAAPSGAGAGRAVRRAPQFPPIGELPYLADARARTPSTGSRSSRSADDAARAAPTGPTCRTIAVADDWDAALHGPQPAQRSSGALPAFLQQRRWFARQGTRTHPHASRIADAVPLGRTAGRGRLRLRSCTSSTPRASRRPYLVPLALADGRATPSSCARASPDAGRRPGSSRGDGERRCSYDAARRPGVRRRLAGRDRRPPHVHGARRAASSSRVDHAGAATASPAAATLDRRPHRSAPSRATRSVVYRRPAAS